VLEDVIVPVHAVGDHDKGCAVPDKIQRHERVLGKTSGAVTLAVLGGQFVQIE
jgi:hypothetical protein